MTHQAIDEATLRTLLKELPGWIYEDNSIKRNYNFSTFERAIAFMVECAPTIARENHHPEWTNVHNRLSVTYRTHDAGNVVTDEDIKMARELEKIYQQGYR